MRPNLSYCPSHPLIYLTIATNSDACKSLCYKLNSTKVFHLRTSTEDVI